MSTVILIYQPQRTESAFSLLIKHLKLNALNKTQNLWSKSIVSKHETTLLYQRRAALALSNNLSQLGPGYLLKGESDWDEQAFFPLWQ